MNTMSNPLKVFYHASFGSWFWVCAGPYGKDCDGVFSQAPCVDAAEAGDAARQHYLTHLCLAMTPTGLCVLAKGHEPIHAKMDARQRVILDHVSLADLNKDSGALTRIMSGQHWPQKPKRRLAGCVARWPEARTGEYDPRCCRFPKSCSADIYDERYVRDYDLEPE